MNQTIIRAPRYTHSRSLDNVFGMVLCISISAWCFYMYFTTNTEFVILVLAVPMLGISLYMIDVVATSIMIHGDEYYLYIKPRQPISFKKRYKFKRSEIKQTKVDTIRKVNHRGVSVWHNVVLITNDNDEHNVLIARDKREALSVKKELKKWCIFK